MKYEHQLRKLSSEERKNLSSEEIFHSAEFSSYLQKMGETLLRHCGITKRLSLTILPTGIAPGWTDGKKEYLVPENTITEAYNDIYAKFTALLGIHFHEIAHIIYCDFAEEQKAIDKIKAGEFYGELPVPKTQAEVDALTEMKDALQNSAYRLLFQQIFNDVTNTIDDPHDEGKIIDEFGGIVEKGIATSREALFRSFDYAENILANDKATKLQKLYALMLEFARFEDVFARDLEQCVCDNDIMKMVIDMAKPLSQARWTDDVAYRFTQINAIFLIMWPIIKEALDEAEQQQNQTGAGNPQSNSNGNSSDGQTGSNGNPGSGNPNSSGNTQSMNHSAAAIQAVVNGLVQTASNTGANAAPQNQSTSKVASANHKQAQKGQQAQGGQKTPSQTKASANTNGTDKQIKEALEAIARGISDQKAEEKLEADITSDLMAEIPQLELGPTHRGHIRPHRILGVTEQDKKLYERQMADLKGYSRRLQKLIREALADIQQGSILHHRIIGNRLEIKNAYRPDQKFYASKKLPQDYPSMAVSVLVDMSGSMQGARMNSAMRAAMLLYDFATGLGIPVMVAGHNTQTRGCAEYYVFSRFDAIGKQDAFRLAKLSTGGCNRDGAAIAASVGLLAKRPEEVKLMFVISDGQPNDGNYSGSSARADIQNIVKSARRNGIEVFAAAIGNDKEHIQAIYGDGFLDITDLSKFPKMLTGMVKKRILRNI